MACVAHGQMRNGACLHDLHSAVCKCHNILQYDILCHRQKYEDHVATGAVLYLDFMCLMACMVDLLALQETQIQHPLQIYMGIIQHTPMI